MFKVFRIHALAVCMLVVQPVHAALLEVEDYFSGTPNLSIPLTFIQFDPSWGVLNSVQFTVNLYAYGGALRVDNDSGSPASSQVAFGSQVSLSGGEELILLNGSFQPVIGTLIAATSNSLDLAADDGDAEVGGGFSMQGPDYGEVNGASVFNTKSGTLGAMFIDQFYGDGTVAISVDASQYFQLGTLGGAQQQLDPLSVSGSVMITYNYTGDGPPPEDPPGPEPASAVPEPSALSFLVAAGMLLLLVGRSPRRIDRTPAS